MAMFELTVTPDGGDPIEVSAGLRDIRIWEKTHAKRSLGMLQDGANISATILFEVAYAACRRQGIIAATLTEDDFVEAFEIDVETPEEKRARKAAERFADEARAAAQHAQGEPDEATEGDAEVDPTPAAH